MSTAIIFYSEHHGNTRKLLDAIAEKNDVTLSGDKLRKYFPRSYTPLQIENTIFKLLDAWQKKRQRDQSR